MRTIAALLAISLVASACGSDDPASPSVFTVNVTAPKQTISVGESVQLTTTARDVNGVTISGAKFTYSTSAASVVNVNADGRVIGLAPGSASITASSGGQSSSPFAITVSLSSSVGAVVTMPNTTFSPSTSTIRVGQSVVFFFPALAHTVTFAQRTGKPADIPATQNVEVSRTFAVAGTFPFDCTIHAGMSGQVVVNP